MDDDRHAERRGDRVDGDVVMGRADPAGGEQIVVAGPAARSPPRRSGRRRRGRPAPRRAGSPAGSARRATWATFVSWVRPERISSPMTSSAGGPDAFFGHSNSVRAEPVEACPYLRRGEGKAFDRLRPNGVCARRSGLYPSDDRISGDQRHRSDRPQRRDQAPRARRLRRHARAPAGSPPRSSTRSSRMSFPA